MPEAWAAYSAPVTVPDRQWFEHAHEPSSAEFPPLIEYEQQGLIIWKVPDDWTGAARFRLWFLGNEGFHFQNSSVRIDAATCDQLYNVHTQTAGIDFTTVLNEYECVSLLVTHATVLAAIAACDVVQVFVDNGDEGHAYKLVGLEVVEA